MTRQTKVTVLGILLTFITIKGQGQCSFLDGKFETGHYFKKNIRYELDPKKASAKNELISFLRIDSLGSTQPSWYAAILFHQEPTGHIDIEFHFQNKKIIKARGQRPQVSTADTIYFDDNELVFPIDGTDLGLILHCDLVSIRIKARHGPVTFFPEKDLFKRMMKCIM